MTTPITFGSLFSGAGGFDLGLERAGWECKFQVEWDKHCQQVLKYHWADVPKWEDVQQVNGAELPPVEVIAWGSPCQDLSTAGKRAGLSGEKSSMFFEGIRIIKEMREATNGTYPVVSIWENVAGSITSADGDDFETVLRELANTGCDHLEWRLLDAQWFGIPQRRRRMFVCTFYGTAASRTGGHQVLAVTSRNSDTGQKHEPGHKRSSDTTGERNKQTPRPIVIDRASFMQGKNALYKPYIALDDVMSPLIAAGVHGVAQTMTTIDGEDQLIIRKLTEIEAERLMGWTDDHTRFRADGKETSSTQRYKMCGNGVAAPVATWIAQKITPLLRTDNA